MTTEPGTPRMRMPPIALSIALHYHCHGDDFPGYDPQRGWPPAVDEWIVRFAREALLVHTGKTSAPRYKATPRLYAFVDALCSVPLPEQVWVVRWPKEGGE